ncbi:MAG TPA: hypothetical protein VGE39_15970, partial [Prosthecobacter sp.]
AEAAPAAVDLGGLFEFVGGGHGAGYSRGCLGVCQVFSFQSDSAWGVCFFFSAAAGSQGASQPACLKPQIAEL